ncbi:hypothetical protein EP232_06305 [bacterium]|nr:MAG: hypothetical protein EP232_06305 [bacterium]
MQRRDRSRGMMSLTWPFTVLALFILMWPNPSSSSLAQALNETSNSSAKLTGMDIEETPESAVIVFEIDDPSKSSAVEYEVVTYVKLSKKWIDLEFPVVRTRIYEDVETGGEILGKILVEETHGGAGTRISIEIISASINYSIRQKDGSLVFSVTTGQ